MARVTDRDPRPTDASAGDGAQPENPESPEAPPSVVLWDDSPTPTADTPEDVRPADAPHDRGPAPS
jgi:hypothetical protein